MDRILRGQPTKRALHIAHVVWVVGFTHEEAAKVLGISTGSVKNQLYRLRVRLGLGGVPAQRMCFELERLGFTVDLYAGLHERPLPPAVKLYLAAFDLFLASPEDDASVTRRVMELARTRAGLPAGDRLRLVGKQGQGKMGYDIRPLLKHLEAA